MRYLTIPLVLVALTAGPLPRAAAKPHAVSPSEANPTWTNGDLARLAGIPGLISVVGQDVEKDVSNVDPPTSQQTTEKAQWYADRAASLNAKLELDKARLGDFVQALDDARELKSTTGGVIFSEEHIGITPEATIDILQSRVSETQHKLDALANLARQNDIPPGILRDHSQDISATTALTGTQGDIATDGGDL
jgi:hypothetical protein